MNHLANPTAVPAGNSTASGSNPRVENAASVAHKTVDRIADAATTQVDRVSGTVHRAVNQTADAASMAADWATQIPQQARRVQATLSESARSAVQARPLASLAGVAAVGYLLGRLARL